MHLTDDVAAALPKVELHLHLEGALRPATAAELADRYGLPLPSTGPFDGLGDFVVAYERARDLVGSLDDLRRAARELVEDAAGQGVVWSEVHVVPPTYAGRLGAAEAVLDAVLDGFAAGASETSAAGAVLGVNRGLDDAAAESRCGSRRRTRAAAWWGTGSPATRRTTRRAGSVTCSTAHARPGCARCRTVGRAQGRRASARASRSSARTGSCHGVRAVEDPDLVRLLAHRQVCLDVCPTSNLALGVAKDLGDHPLPVLQQAGVPVTLNSDCPLFFGAPAVAEYQAAARAFDLDAAAVTDIAATSLTASACPAERTDAALGRLATWRAQRTSTHLATREHRHPLPTGSRPGGLSAPQRTSRRVNTGTRSPAAHDLAGSAHLSAPPDAGTPAPAPHRLTTWRAQRTSTHLLTREHRHPLPTGSRPGGLSAPQRTS